MNRNWVCIAAVGLAVVVAGFNVAPAEPPGGESKKPMQASTAAAQKAAWQRLRSMVGVWKTSSKKAASQVEQHYKLVVGDQFLHVRTTSVSKAEKHEDWEILSYDTTRHQVVLRQFVSEGYVNQFVLSQIKDNGRTMVFDSEASENAPPGLRVRQILAFESDDRISQTLDLAPPGKKLSRCVDNTLSRAK